ncbi:malonic semialdehyde reductase [Kitasatospora sp. NPDC056138]|uniref:malonic semialdehyde reductase n=1 Tax=Kitasatospora sp. NPDC056138 TaxID=3345724 RepID=UPI0035DA090A
MKSAATPQDLLALPSSARDLLFHEARTAHTFTAEPVGDDLVEAIHRLIRSAPTSLNSQPLRGLLVRSEQARERLVERMAPNNRAKTRQAPLTAILAADLDFHDTLPRLVPHLPGARELFADAPVRHEAALLNASLQIGYFILGVRAAGLAAGPMSGFDADAVTEEFFPGRECRPLVVVNIGRPGPDAFRPRGPRLEFSEVFRTV